MTLELVPFDQPKAETSPAAAPSALEIDIVPMGTKQAEAPPTGAEPDRFEREATRQYEEGHIDEPLWTRALAQANGDKEAAVAIYLRARATALRLLNRDLRTERRPATPAPSPHPGAFRRARRGRSIILSGKRAPQTGCAIAAPADIG